MATMRHNLDQYTRQDDWWEGVASLLIVAISLVLICGIMWLTAGN